jgi:hypothetical protein
MLHNVRTKKRYVLGLEQRISYELIFSTQKNVDPIVSFARNRIGMRWNARARMVINQVAIALKKFGLKEKELIISSSLPSACPTKPLHDFPNISLAISSIERDCVGMNA